MKRYLFPRWSNKVLPMLLIFGIGPMGTAAVAGVWYYATNKHLEVGYTPVQPVEFSHKLHAGDLGMDCRYCHNTVEESAFAQIPPTQTCMNCHEHVKKDSVALLPVRESMANDTPIPWVRVHNLADYAFFDHRAHLAAGVGCSSCHGRIDQMPRVSQVEPLSMSWCLDCHRDPAPHIRPVSEITKMDWESTHSGGHGSIATTANGRELHPPTHCSGCHR